MLTSFLVRNLNLKTWQRHVDEFSSQNIKFAKSDALLTSILEMNS